MRRLQFEHGIALISVVLLALVLVSVGVGIALIGQQSNVETKRDELSEAAFQAADSGYNRAVQCLEKITAASQVGTCTQAPSTATEIKVGTNVIGQYRVDVTNSTGDDSTGIIKEVSIDVRGYAPKYDTAYASGGRSAQRINGVIDLVQVSGFADTLFAGSGKIIAQGGSATSGEEEGASSDGGTFVVTGSAYASDTVDFEKGVASGGGEEAGEEGGPAVVDDVRADMEQVRVQGKFVLKRGEVKSIHAGGNVDMWQNTRSEDFVKSCGAGSSPGDVTMLTGSRIGPRPGLQWKGAKSEADGAGAHVESATGVTEPWYKQEVCDAPAALTLPSFTYNAANYPGWTILTFTSRSSANTCLSGKTASSCGGTAIGSSSSNLGYSTRPGTLVRVNVASCTDYVNLLTGATVNGNFTLVSTCKIAVGGTYQGPSGSSTARQLTFITDRNTGTKDIDVKGPFRVRLPIHALLYAPGQVYGKGTVDIQAGAIHAGTMKFEPGAASAGEEEEGGSATSLAFTIGRSTHLLDSQPAGFTFVPPGGQHFLATALLWRQAALG